MSHQWLHAAGFLWIFAMPLLFLISAVSGLTWLAFGVVVFLFPLARLAFGSLPAQGTIEWEEGIATLLDGFPVLYVPVLIVCVFGGLWTAGSDVLGEVGAVVGLALSLWMTLLFGTCVAHELIHRRDRRQVMLGHLLAGMCGYPALGIEHLAHHGRPGDWSRAEVPRRNESLWRFAGRRLRRIVVEFFGTSAPLWNPRSHMPSLVHTRVAMLATVATGAAFAALVGWAGMVLYLGMIGGVAFGIQLITYIQHWGLGDDNISDRVAFGRGWEEDCRFQAWITLGISLHDEHHRDSRRPFYRLGLAADSPRLPAGYVLLMFASLLPPVWRHAMEPALAHWLAEPTRPISAGHRLTCFGMYGA